MQTIHVLERTGADGVLHVRIPLGRAEAEYEVVVVVQPRVGAGKGTPEERGWPPGFFEKTAGAWQGELERAPQGDFEDREVL
jgi:hypothetical protein